jgi:4'-phosphopantetheinyl transferase
MVYIYFAFTDTISKTTRYKHQQQLPEHLKNRLNNITHDGSRTNSLSGLIITNKLLTDLQTGLSLNQLSYHHHGKPLLPNGYSISIAHSDNIVLCACSATGNVGVDVEAVENSNSLDYEDYLTPAEITTLSVAYDPNKVFKQMWVRKEAVLKADGIGLLHPLSELDVTLNTAKLLNTTYYLHNVAIEKGYVAALATTQPHCIVTVKEVSF